MAPSGPSYEMVVLTCLIFLSSMLTLPTALSLNLEASQNRTEIRIRAGVLHAPPMAIVEELENGDTAYEGFQLDLLRRLQMFAAEDGVDFQVELERSPSQYGEAFDLMANDCNTTENPNPLESCERFDILLGDYYSNAQRYMRADLSPAWMKTAMATIKYIEKEEGVQDFTTLKQAEEARATVCVPLGTYLAKVVREKFPGSNYLECDPSTSNCIDNLKNGTCILYADDELALHYTASHDPSLEMTGEYFNAQYIVWPMREDLPGRISKMIKKWMYKAIENATLDELYYEYFAKERCPIGTAGDRCELPCDPGTYGCAHVKPS